MVDPLSLALGIGVAIVVLLAFGGLFLGGYVTARSPDHVVDMTEVSSYHRHVNANRALSQDVEDTEE